MAKTGVATQKRSMTRKRLIIIGILTGTVILFVLFSPYGVVTRLALEGDIEALKGDIQALRMTSDSLRGIVRKLETDTTEIERLARERFGYVRQGEEVYVITRDSTE